MFYFTPEEKAKILMYRNKLRHCLFCHLNTWNENVADISIVSAGGVQQDEKHDKTCPYFIRILQKQLQIINSFKWIFSFLSLNENVILF